VIVHIATVDSVVLIPCQQPVLKVRVHILVSMPPMLAAVAVSTVGYEPQSLKFCQDDTVAVGVGVVARLQTVDAPALT
jgi:hypothetical protein